MTAAPAAPPVPSSNRDARTQAPIDRVRRHRRRVARGDLLTVAAWTSAAIAIALYLVGGLSVASVGDAAVAAGIAAGLVGSDLVLVMLVLAARVPLIDRTIGHDAAMAVHRRLGKPAFYLLLAHGALISLGYAWNDRVDVVRETVGLFGSADMPLAYVSIVLFTAVIVTSLVAVRRRFRHYEIWHAIHLLSYAAVLTALPHQLSQGSVLAEGTWQRVYWIALYAAALGSIVAFRVIEPVLSSLRHGIVVERVERIADDAVSIHLRGRRLDLLRADGGQFFTWRFWTPRTWWHGHPMSLSAAPDSTRARITVRELGDGTRRLAQALRPGTPVGFSGPFGIFTDDARGRDRIAVFAAGIGATPVRALLERMDAPPGAVTVIVRARDRRSLYLWTEIRAICDARGWVAYTSVGRRAASGWLADTDVARGVSLRSAVPAIAESEVYICGPAAWADTVESEVRTCGVRTPHIHRERFDW